MTVQNDNSVADRNALGVVRDLLLAERTEVNHWVGELSASALSTATAVSAFSFYRDSKKAIDVGTFQRQIDAGVRWLVGQQNDDGGWGDTDKNYSNISTSMLVVAAFHAANVHEEFSQVISSAQCYIDQQGGVEGIRRRYGDDKTFAVPILANCAMAGLVDWKEVGVLPFEAAVVPQRFYNLLNLPVVSYAIPALVAIGQAKFHFDPPWNPLTRWVRKWSVGRSLEVLNRMQPASGGFLEAIPLTSFVCMALIKCGRADHPVVQKGITFLQESFRCEGNETGTWPIDTNLATWVTTLSVNALCSDEEFGLDSQPWRDCFDWILSCQNRTIHPFTGAAPGGWGWTDLSGAVPDADDTPGALIALSNFYERANLDDSEKSKVESAAIAGVNWLLGLQNRDGGWPTFCRGWGRLPFDRSGSDLTAHVIRALLIWKETWQEKDGPIGRIEKAIDRGFVYLAKKQRADGSWLPLWFGNQDQNDDINPFYGTAKVLHAYYESDRLHTKAAQNGLKWVRENQNHDGGWGGGPSVSFSLGSSSCSSVEETALCTEALLMSEAEAAVNAAGRGLQWLELAVDEGAVTQSTPIGFYFAKLWYFEKLYPLIFATSALGRGKAMCGKAKAMCGTSVDSREKKLDSIHQ